MTFFRGMVDAAGPWIGLAVKAAWVVWGLRFVHGVVTGVREVLIIRRYAQEFQDDGEER